MKCPVCSGIELKIAERQGVEIDYCPECRGIWLDRGELDKILERSYTQAAPQTHGQQPQPQNYQQHQPQRYDKHHDDHGYGHNSHHRKKSWLAEIFD